MSVPLHRMSDTDLLSDLRDMRDLLAPQDRQLVQEWSRKGMSAGQREKAERLWEECDW